MFHSRNTWVYELKSVKTGNVARRDFLKGGGVILVGASSLALAGCGSDGGGAGPINATIAGASATGYFRAVGETINAIVRDSYPGSSIAYKPGSPAGSLAQVAKGRAQLALAIATVEEKLADAGKPPFTDSLKGQYQSIMEVHRRQDFASVALQSWAEEHGITSWDDIAKKQPPLRVGINQRGNLQIVKVAETLFAQHGITFQDIRGWGGKVVFQSGGDTPALLKDRKIDMYFNAQFHPISDLLEVAAGGVALTWISMDPKKVEATAQRWGQLATTVKAGTYEWLKQDESTIRQQSDMIVSTDMPEDEVYRLTKAIFGSKKRMRQIHPAMKDFSAETGVRVGERVPLHPGAERYYREQGLVD